MNFWTARDIPSQAGKFAIVTGTGGLGYETALELIRAGAEVVLAGRNERKGDESVAKLRSAVPGANVRYGKLDLASLASVQEFADGIVRDGKAIDVLVNNAGIMMLPVRQTTTDGFELQLGTNYLGHFALTARLLPLLRAAKAPRVVSLSSLAHRRGAINFDDLQSERHYQPISVYGQSKLAMLMFALELQRRSDAGHWGLLSTAAHPGWARTELIANGPGTAGIFGFFSNLGAPLFSQSAVDGALPTLFAATSSAARPSGYYGPAGLFELKGPPTDAAISKRAADVSAEKRLWDVSTELTHVAFAG